MKNKKIITMLSLILVALIAIFAIAYYVVAPHIQSGNKEINVTVVFADKTKKNYEIKTNAEFLADALLEEKIIAEKSESGLYTIVAGERADYNLDSSWWCLTKDGEMTNFGFNEQPIADGDNYEITNTPSDAI